MLSLTIECLSGGWNATRLFQIDLNITPMSKLSIDTDGPVYFSYYPVTTSDPIITIQVRIYSVHNSDAEKFADEELTLNYDLEGGALLTSKIAKTEYSALDRCVHTEINIMIPIHPLMANIDYNIEVERSDIIIDSSPLVTLGRVTLKGEHGSIVVTNLIATGIDIRNSDASIRTNNTKSREMLLHTENDRIKVENHIVDNVDLGGEVTSFIDAKTSNSKMQIGVEFADITQSALVNAKTSNGDIKINVANYAGYFDMRTSNGKVNMIGDETQVVYTESSETKKEGTFKEAGLHTIYGKTSNSNIKFEFQ
jgi:hypothetical protein